MEATSTNEGVKTVYIGNLGEDATEQLLCALFVQFGSIESCKITQDGSGAKIAFIEYKDQKTAQLAIATMNGRVFLGKTIKVSWAYPSQPGNGNGAARGQDNSNHYAIYVGDIGSDLMETELRDAFSKFGTISDCRIIRDPVTRKCKHYGFISFEKQDAAENAIKQMDGFWIGNRSIRTNWARKQTFSSGLPASAREQKSYRDVNRLTGHLNTTIYCGNITSGLTESLLDRMFSPFGTINEVRVVPQKCYGFVTFAEKSSAVRAILDMDHLVVNGDIIKVSWRNERNVEPEPQLQQSSVAYGGEAGQGQYPYYPGAEYWQQMENYQQACAMYLQQQNFYHTNAASTSGSPYPFYAVTPYGQTPSTSAGNGAGRFQKQQSSTRGS